MYIEYWSDTVDLKQKKSDLRWQRREDDKLDVSEEFSELVEVASVGITRFSRWGNYIDISIYTGY